jgi:hypothetical protein
MWECSRESGTVAGLSSALHAILNILICPQLYIVKGSAVSIATGYRLEDASPGRVKNFLRVIQTGSGTHPASYLMGTWGKVTGA